MAFRKQKFDEWAKGTLFEDDTNRVFNTFFNHEFNIRYNIDMHEENLREALDMYIDYLQDSPFMWIGETWVHLKDLVEGKQMKVHKRKFENLFSRVEEDYCTTPEGPCPDHNNRRCRLIQYDMGFIFFLLACNLEGDSNEYGDKHIDISNLDIQVLESEEGSAMSNQMVESTSNNERDKISENDDEEGSKIEQSIFEDDLIDAMEEFSSEKENMCAKDVSCMHALFVEPLDYELPTLTMEEEEKEMKKFLPCQKVFYLNGNQYFLLNDIQNVFQLREDEMLLQLSLAAKEDFIDFDGIPKYDMLEWSPKEALKHTLELVQSQPQALVTDIEFNKICNENGFNMNSSNDSILVEEEGPKKSIDISIQEIIENDEDERVAMICDDFTLRHGGTRKNAKGKDSSIAQYIHTFKEGQIVVFHRAYSPCGEATLTSLIALSKMLGGHALAPNSERAILVEKDFALQALGIGLGMQKQISSYFLTYSAYAIGSNETNVDMLYPYGKLGFLHKKIVEASTSKLLE